MDSFPDLVEIFESKNLSGLYSNEAKPAKFRSLSLVRLLGSTVMTPSDSELLFTASQSPHTPGADEVPGSAGFQTPIRYFSPEKTTARLGSMLMTVNADLVQTTGNLWIYQLTIVSKLYSDFTIYCFPITFLKNSVKRYLVSEKLGRFKAIRRHLHSLQGPSLWWATSNLNDLKIEKFATS